MKKRKTLRSSFVVTFAGTASLAAAAAGCDTMIITNPPPTACPDLVPASGEACDLAEVDPECIYQDECGNDVTATCDGSDWTVEYTTSCNPPPVLSCPADLPLQGDPCWGEGSCTYDACGGPVTVTCPVDQYELQYASTCNPPPPCEGYTTVEGCTTDPTCRWLVPGCADSTQTPLPAEGCFPIAPCVDDTECAGLTCTEVMMLPPCEGDGCACGAPTSVCL